MKKYIVVFSTILMSCSNDQKETNNAISLNLVSCFNKYINTHSNGTISDYLHILHPELQKCLDEEQKQILISEYELIKTLLFEMKYNKNIYTLNPRYRVVKNIEYLLAKKTIELLGSFSDIYQIRFSLNDKNNVIENHVLFVEDDGKPYVVFNIANVEFYKAINSEMSMEDLKIRFPSEMEEMCKYEEELDKIEWKELN